MCNIGFNYLLCGLRQTNLECGCRGWCVNNENDIKKTKYNDKNKVPPKMFIGKLMLSNSGR